jgi:antitoxin component HigA of HigAB toxin-antitoxin module
MNSLPNTPCVKWKFCLLLVAAIFCLGVTNVTADEHTGYSVYDEAAYTEYVENSMKELDRLYLEFCGTCGVEGAKAAKARQEFLTIVRDLMQHMNAKFDNLDPKMGGALSATETLVSIHALTMLVDILTATQLEQWAQHPYNE